VLGLCQYILDIYGFTILMLAYPSCSGKEAVKQVSKYYHYYYHFMAIILDNVH